jgi:predicted metal-dependent phosphoesterase TrpH
MVPQDLHIHTTWSTGDGAIVPEQTIELIARLRHARVAGISDHLELIGVDRFEDYRQEVRAAGLKVGMEVNGHGWVQAAAEAACDYRIYHCFDRDEDYRGLERLVETGTPVIVAHPNALGTDLSRLPPESLIEINNRYVWRSDWRAFYGSFVDRFEFVIGSDAHQPNWINQTVARYVAAELGVKERVLFAPRAAGVP